MLLLCDDLPYPDYEEIQYQICQEDQVDQHCRSSPVVQQLYPAVYEGVVLIETDQDCEKVQRAECAIVNRVAKIFDSLQAPQRQCLDLF